MRSCEERDEVVSARDLEVADRVRRRVQYVRDPHRGRGLAARARTLQVKRPDRRARHGSKSFE